MRHTIIASSDINLHTMITRRITMNAYILNCFIKDKAEKVPKTQSPTHELMKQLKNIEKQKRMGDKYNILVEAYNSILYII